MTNSTCGKLRLKQMLLRKQIEVNRILLSHSTPLLNKIQSKMQTIFSFPFKQTKITIAPLVIVNAEEDKFVKASAVRTSSVDRVVAKVPRITKRRVSGCMGSKTIQEQIEEEVIREEEVIKLVNEYRAEEEDVKMYWRNQINSRISIIQENFENLLNPIVESTIEHYQQTLLNHIENYKSLLQRELEEKKKGQIYIQQRLSDIHTLIEQSLHTTHTLAGLNLGEQIIARRKSVAVLRRLSLEEMASIPKSTDRPKSTNISARPSRPKSMTLSKPENITRTSFSHNITKSHEPLPNIQKNLSSNVQKNPPKSSSPPKYPPPDAPISKSHKPLPNIQKNLSSDVQKNPPKSSSPPKNPSPNVLTNLPPPNAHLDIVEAMQQLQKEKFKQAQSMEKLQERGFRQTLEDALK